jgi:hypothetical protein
MYQLDFTAARAGQHRADLISDARHARDVRLANPRRRRRLLVTLRRTRPVGDLPILRDVTLQSGQVVAT